MSTGTVSFVRVFSALNDVVMTRLSIQYATLSITGKMKNRPGTPEIGEFSKPQDNSPLPLVGNPE